MNPQSSGGAMDESKETAPKQEQSLSEEIMSLMRGEEPMAEEQTEEVHEEIPKPEEEEIPPQTEETTEEEPDVTAPKGEEWPGSARKRVAEESDKRKRANARADKAESQLAQWQDRVQQLEAALQESSLPRPSPQDPLADVLDATGLQKAKGHFENVKEAATRALDENPTLDEIELVVGKSQDGQDRTETFTRRQLSEMRRKADHALSNLIPERGRILAQRAQADAMAMQVYPQFAEHDGNNEWSGFVRETLALFPALAKVPDIAIWLGHALEGRRVTLERLTKQFGNGATAAGTPSTAREIISAASRSTFRKAPPVSTQRVPSQTTPRRGADVEGARKVMKANPGSDEAMEAFIDAKLFRSPSRGYTKVS